MVISIDVPEADWGGARATDVMAVLRSTAACFENGLSERTVEAVRVEPTLDRCDPPVTAFQRTGAGRVRILLSAREHFWAQYAYQFAHELCHVMANFRPPLQHPWLWVEESLCELGSLFALRSLASSWIVAPPFPNWSSFAPNFQHYFAARASQLEHRLPIGQTFREWLASRIELLQRDARRRADNTIVALELLPIFEAEPSAWRAVRYLNLWHDSTISSIGALFDRWREVTPEPQRHHIDSVEACLTKH